MQKDLDSLRRQIQNIDHEIVTLLNRRIDAVQQIGRIKKEQGLSIIDKKREKQVLSHVMRTSHNSMHTDSIQKIYQTIIQICRNKQIDTSPEKSNEV